MSRPLLTHTFPKTTLLISFLPTVKRFPIAIQQLTPKFSRSLRMMKIPSDRPPNDPNRRAVEYRFPTPVHTAVLQSLKTRMKTTTRLWLVFLNTRSISFAG